MTAKSGKGVEKVVQLMMKSLLAPIRLLLSATFVRLQQHYNKISGKMGLLS